MRNGIVFGALLCVAGLAQADDAAAKKYLDGIQGNWTITSMQRAGMDAPEESIKSITIVIKGDTLTLKIGKDEEKNATIVVDPSQKPVSMDLTPKDGPNAGKPMLGLVSLEKGVLTMVWADDREAKARPKDLTSTKDNKNFLLVLKKGS